MTESHYSIQSLQSRRKDLQQQLDESKTAIAGHWGKLFAPAQTDTKVQMWVSQAERAYAIYDGVMLGYKLFRRFNSVMSLFHKGKKKNKTSRK